MKTNRIAALLLGTALVLPGCSKEEAAPKAADPAPPNIADATSVAKAQEAMKEKVVAAAPLADRSTPLASYQKLAGGRGLMFAYLAVSTVPIDYQKVAAVVSPEYANTSDEFRRRDLMQALRQGIDAEIEKARGNKYYYMTVGGVLDKYDFATQSFRHQAFVDPTSQIYFQGAGYSYKLNFANSEQFKHIVVTDEAQARKIEALRAGLYSDNMSTQVYFFASSAELGDTIVKAEIVKIRLVDREGNVLAEM